MDTGASRGRNNAIISEPVTMKNIPVTVTQNEQIAPQCYRLVLSSPLHNFNVRPGQFVMLKVGTEYDPLLRRPFAAFCTNTVTSTSLEIYYQVVGRGTQHMAALMPGSSLQLLGPLGNGFSIPSSIKHAVLVAGGMGIVPIRCLVHSLCNNESVRLTLFYGTQTADSLLFLEEFNALGIPVKVSTDDGTRGRRGLVTDQAAHFLKGLDAEPDETVCFTCGPRQMLRAMAEVTAPLRIPCQVSLETKMACGIGACLGCVVKRKPLQSRHSRPPDYARVCLEGPVFEAQEIAW